MVVVATVTEYDVDQTECLLYMAYYIPSLSNQVYEGYRCTDLITVHTHCLVKYTLKCFIHYALLEMEYIIVRQCLGGIYGI